MLSSQQIEKLGAHVVGGLVVYKHKVVPGIWTEDGFSPAQGSLLDPKTEDSLVTGNSRKRAVAVANATDVEVK